ncbi:MAG: sigma-70 family RNA polymerase sigma factor [Flavobacterium nitrogenifigens]|uniref:sigma-70 family RNA polymerase sigma factor n=1 Tax=Flavobacterium nitrogenifigens TaxID=1617283 RepID=UPI002809B32D|nr:sigma-70 family RNA polymerase sigma factor [Flavobacterium nitrogenifigens]MDQ8014749.1 sigma-70 family RNA polymerase sigma factor [Flavobacterium nitrogenifigens]
MKQFHKEIKNVNKELQYEEFLKLFSEYKQSKSQQIRDKIFNANVKLVFLILKKHQSPDIDDLEQFGFIGLINAIENFDPDKNIRFSTYAIKCITNEIQRGLKQVNNIVSVPIAAQNKEDYTKPSFLSIDDFEPDPDPESDFDRQLFWIIVQHICTEEETDILLKRFCYEEKLTLAKIGSNWNVAPDQLSKAPTQLMWKKLNGILKKLRSNEILKKYYA